MCKVLVGTQQRDVMSDAELCNQGVHRCNLHGGLTTGVPKICGRDMVFSVRLNQAQSGKTFNDLSSCYRSSEPLKEFLKNQARSYHDL